MSKGTEKPSFFEKLATLIVDKRNLIFFLYACALIFCLFSRNWVSVCNDITEYLPDTTETRQGLTLMEEEFTTFGTARVMVSNVTYDIAADLASQMEEIEGVTSASFGRSDAGADTRGRARSAAARIDAGGPFRCAFASQGEGRSERRPAARPARRASAERGRRVRSRRRK